jgi:hypothetical protein
VTLDSEFPPVVPAGSPVVANVRAARGGLPSWLLLLTIGVGALALGAAHLPPIFKKLGLFAVADGLLVGLLAAWLDQVTGRFRGHLGMRAATVVLLTLLGQVGIAAESYRIDPAEQLRLERADPKQLLARRLLESAAEPPDAKSQATLKEFRREYTDTGPSFADYLRFRVSGIGIRSRPLAVVFWGIEVALGGFAAGLIYWRRAAKAGGSVAKQDA